MSKYIDADLLKQILKPVEWGTPDERWVPEHEIGAMLDYFPAADVVEVVRCKDCVNWKDIFPYSTCELLSGHWEEDMYCSYGEKRDE